MNEDFAIGRNSAANLVPVIQYKLLACFYTDEEWMTRLIDFQVEPMKGLHLMVIKPVRILDIYIFIYLLFPIIPFITHTLVG